MAFVDLISVWKGTILNNVWKGSILGKFCLWRILGLSKWGNLEKFFGSIQMGMRCWRRRRVADRDQTPRARQIKNKASSCLFTFPLACPPLPAALSPSSEGFVITGSDCFLLDEGFHIIL